MEGVRKNREHWLEIAAQHSLIPPDNHEKDSNDNMAVSKPNTPDTNSESSDTPVLNNSTSVSD